MKWITRRFELSFISITQQLSNLQRTIICSTKRSSLQCLRVIQDIIYSIQQNYPMCLSLKTNTSVIKDNSFRFYKWNAKRMLLIWSKTTSFISQLMKIIYILKLNLSTESSEKLDFESIFKMSPKQSFIRMIL